MRFLQMVACVLARSEVVHELRDAGSLCASEASSKAVVRRAVSPSAVLRRVDRLPGVSKRGPLSQTVVVLENCTLSR